MTHLRFECAAPGMWYILLTLIPSPAFWYSAVHIEVDADVFSWRYVHSAPAGIGR